MNEVPVPSKEAIVVQAMVLCESPQAAQALQDVFSALNSGVFDSSSTILDFAMGIHQTVQIDDSYSDGEFLNHIPNGQLLQTANCVSLPV